MRKLSVTVVRTFLGLIFTVFGLNGFFQFLPMPAPTGMMGEMMGVYIKMGYMFPLIFATQLVGGILLLTNMFAALGVVLLAPVIVNIVCLHAFVDPSGLPIAIVVLLAELFLAYSYKDKYALLLKAK